MVEENEISVPLAPLQIVVGAMVAGLVVFGIVSLFLGPLILEEAAAARLFLLVLGVLGITEIVAFQIVRVTMIGRFQRPAEEHGGGSARTEGLLTAYRSLVLVRAAMCDGFTTFALVIVLLYGERLALGAAAAGLLLLIAGMPTPGRCARFIESVTGGNPYAG